MIIFPSRIVRMQDQLNFSKSRAKLKWRFFKLPPVVPVKRVVCFGNMRSTNLPIQCLEECLEEGLD